MRVEMNSHFDTLASGSGPALPRSKGRVVVK